MRSLAIVCVLSALVAGPVEAQSRGRANRGSGTSQGIPPGHLPPSGLCRVWYDGVPPGRQPRATNCNEAERIASRDRDARVIYGDDNYYRNDRSSNYPGGTSRFPEARSTRGYNAVAYDNGYRDGVEKGREDAGDRDSYDPVRHSRYRSADRGYNSRYGTKEQYKLTYRDGFEAGYAEGYRQNGGRSSSSNNGALRWPF
jgi:hypothetical protein